MEQDLSLDIDLVVSELQVQPRQEEGGSDSGTLLVVKMMKNALLLLK